MNHNQNLLGSSFLIVNDLFVSKSRILTNSSNLRLSFTLSNAVFPEIIVEHVNDYFVKTVLCRGI